MENNRTNKHSLWVGIGKQILSGLVGAIFAAFLLGGARQKVIAVGKDMEDWKTEWKTVHAPRIERMDRVGTTSFDLFHQEYLRTQARQEATLKEHDKEIRELERKADP